MKSPSLKSPSRIDVVLVSVAALAILPFVWFAHDPEVLPRASAGATWPYRTFGYVFAIPTRSFLLAASCWVPWVLVGAYVRPRDRLGPLFRLVWALVAGLLFWVFRDVVRSAGDAPNLLRDPLGSLVVGDPYTFLDELLGLYAPWRIARGQVLSGVDPREAIVFGYAVVSLASGVLFAFVALTYAARTREPVLALALLVLAANSLHFSGYLENYGTASMLLATGFLLAATALREQRFSARTLLATNALFTFAVVWHGVSVWSVFSLVFLAATTADREAKTRGLGVVTSFARVAGANLAVSAAILGSVYAAFHFDLKPDVRFVHAGERTLLPLDALFDARPLAEHALAFARVGTPALLVLFAALVAAPRATRDALRSRDVAFALLYLAGFIVHQLVWPTTLGLDRDWDLFGFTFLPCAYLAIRVAESAGLSSLGRASAIALALVLGYSWPLHFAAPFVAPG